MSKLKIPDSIPKEKTELAKEIHRLHESCLHSSQGQFELAKQWRFANLILGVPAAVLAAISGGKALATDGKSIESAILALLAAGFGAVLTTLNPSRRYALAQSCGNSYLEIQTAARQLLLVDLIDVNKQLAREELDKLTTKRDEINRSADPPNRLARFTASRIIDGGGQTYSVDEEE